MENDNQWSRLEGFFKLEIAHRREKLLSLPHVLDKNDFFKLDEGLSIACADRMSENVVGTFSLPLSIAANFIVDNEPVLVPMVTEEPSIVAACSKMAKMVALNGGFHTSIDRSLIKGQIQIYDVGDIDRAIFLFNEHKAELVNFTASLCSNLKQRGGGLVDIGMRLISANQAGPMLIIEPLIDVVDAMGANIVNTISEALGRKLMEFLPGQLGICIVSNLANQRLAKASCEIPTRLLATDQNHDQGFQIAKKMFLAHAFAEADIFRACTHNKGILNGIDAVAIATGNDFRAIEAGAHAFAALGGYRPLTNLYLDENKQILHADLSLPLSIGVVGGSLHIHEGVKFVHKLLGDRVKTAASLASVMVSVGLSQCLAALFALSSFGIQKGHMKLHRKKLDENHLDNRKETCS